jgi:hypothetical protein
MTPKTLARIAGLLYLSMSVCFVIAGSLRARVSASHTEALIDHIRDSVMLVRAAIAIELLSGALFLFTAGALYLLLKHVNRLVAAAMVVFVALAVGLEYLSLVNQYATLTLATHADYAAALGQPSAEALVRLFAELQANGLVIDEMFWGLWLLPLGYLVIKSGLFPRLLGALLIVAGCSWITQLFVHVLAPDHARIEQLLTAGAVGEIVFILWLLVLGARAPGAQVATGAG